MARAMDGGGDRFDEKPHTSPRKMNHPPRPRKKRGSQNKLNPPASRGDTYEYKPWQKGVNMPKAKTKKAADMPKSKYGMYLTKWHNKTRNV